MSKPYFYRIDASSFLAEIMSHTGDKELAKFIKQFALDLVTGIPNSSYAHDLIAEATEYIDKKRLAGSIGGKQKASNAKAPLKHRSSTPLANNNNNKNLKGKPSSAKAPLEYPDWFPLDEWQAFKEMRIKINKPLTAYAESLRVKDLIKLKEQGHDPVEILNQSIVHCWQDLYAPKDSQGNKPYILDQYGGY